MDRSRFDAFTRLLAQDVSRRTALKAFLGLGGVAGASAGAMLRDADAARRGFSGPPIPAKPTQIPVPPTPTPPISECLGLSCNGQCCDDNETVCCDGYCCAGTCHDSQCCPTGQSWCEDVGCCDGECIDGTQCCAYTAVCNGICCGDDARCCVKDDGSRVCTAAGRCCSNADCGGGQCDSQGFCN